MIKKKTKYPHLRLIKENPESREERKELLQYLEAQLIEIKEKIDASMEKGQDLSKSRGQGKIE